MKDPFASLYSSVRSTFEEATTKDDDDDGVGWDQRVFGCFDRQFRRSVGLPGPAVLSCALLTTHAALFTLLSHLLASFFFTVS